MKKLFTLFAMLTMMLSAAMAGDVFTLSLNGSEVSTPAGFFTHDADGKFSFNSKFNGAEYAGITFKSGLKMEGTTKVMFTSSVESNVTIVQSTWSDKTIKFDGEELSVSDATAGTGYREYVISGVAAGDHAITRGGGESGIFYVKVEYTADDPTPALTVQPKAITLSANPLARTKTATVALNGKNLTDGTYSVTMPAVDGLTIDPAQFTVTGGAIEQEFTVSYTSEADVAKATENIVFAVDGLTAEVAVTYQSRAEAYKQKVVTASKVWNWEALTETVTLDENTIPSITDEFVFRELEDQINFGSFDAQSIVLVNTQYPVRNKKFQNGTIKFKTNAPGRITVDFSDTGSSGEGTERYLNVNGKNTEWYTMRDGSSDRKVAEDTDDLIVPPGEVVITGCTAEGESTPIAIYKVTFDPDEDLITLGINSINNDSDNAATYNLNGQRVSAATKGIVVKNGKKTIVK